MTNYPYPPDSPARAAHRLRVSEALRPVQALDVSALPAPDRAIRDAAPSLSASEQLQDLIPKALTSLGNVLEMDPMEYEPGEDRMSVVRAHLSAAEKILNTVVRVDQNRLRARETDTLQDVLETLKSREKDVARVPPLVLEGA